MNNITTEVVRCLVDRGRSVIRVDVPKHEVAVLRAVHGGSEVRVIEQDVDEVELEASAEAEWDRLNRTYKRTGGGDPLRAVWPEGPTALERFGFSSDVRPVDRETDLRAINPKREARRKAKADKQKATA